MKMGFSQATQGFTLFILAACLMAITEARTIVVGGPQNWRLGLNYTVWAAQNSPYYINDKLVFKYEPASGNNTSGYSVYLLPNGRSYAKCDFTQAKLLANTTQGIGEGFVYVLNKLKTRIHYFASAQNGGSQCRSGMRFLVLPLPVTPPK